MDCTISSFLGRKKGGKEGGRKRKRERKKGDKERKLPSTIYLKEYCALFEDKAVTDKL